MEVFIYGLVDPNTSRLRYIGKTDDLERRLKDHMSRCDNDNRPKNLWLRSLKDQDLIPEVEIIESVDYEQWQEAEKAWIDYFGRVIEYDLLNISDGGYGGAEFAQAYWESLSDKETSLVYSDLNESEILEIVDCYINTEMTQKEVGEKYGVDQTCVYDIMRGRTHKWATFKRREVVDEVIARKTEKKYKDLCKFSDSEIYNIPRDFIYKDKTFKDLADDYDVCVGTIRRIVHRIGYDWIGFDLTQEEKEMIDRKISGKLSASDVRDIRRRCEEGTDTQREIAKDFGIHQTMVSKINCGDRFGWVD